MKIYDFPGGPNPRRVRIFLAEKNVDVPFERVDPVTSEHRTRSFLAKNRMGAVPVLELDDGTCISESVAICRFFEVEYPEPPLMGVSAREQAHVEMWNRRVEFGLFRSTVDYFFHTHSFFKDRIIQVPAYAEAAHVTAHHQLEWLDRVLEDREYVSGAEYTIADITAQVAIDLGTPTLFSVEPELANLTSWLERVSERPSAAVLTAPRD